MDLERDTWSRAILFLLSLVFCDPFEELQAVLTEVKLIINNVPNAPHVNNAPDIRLPNTIKTYLTPNHLLFGRLLLCYSNTTSTVVSYLTILSSTVDKINCISNRFLHSWRHEYVVNFREIQRASKFNLNSQKLC